MVALHNGAVRLLSVVLLLVFLLGGHPQRLPAVVDPAGLRYVLVADEAGAHRVPAGTELIIVTDKGTLGELVPACKNQQFVGECSAFLAAVEVPGQRWSMTDLTIMMDHLTLAAHEKGL